MAERTITITTKEELEGKNGTYLKLTDSEGKSHLIFDNLQDKWELCEEGQTVTLTKVKDGKYWNVTDIKPAKEAPKAERSEPRSYQDSPEKRRSIERQTAITLAFQFAAKEGNVDTVRGYLEIAEAIYQWISEGKIPSEPSSVPEKQQPVASKAVAPSDSPTEEDNPYATMNPMQFINDALAKGHKWPDIKKTLNITKIEDIKDVPAAAKVLYGK